jgi:hypothetical protein
MNRGIQKTPVLSANEDALSIASGMSISRRQWFLTTAGTIMVINSVLLGVLTGLAIRAVFDPPLLWIVVGGLFVFGVTLAAHFVYQDRQWSSVRKQIPVIFPSDQEKSKS